MVSNGTPFVRKVAVSWIYLSSFEATQHSSFSGVSRSLAPHRDKWVLTFFGPCQNTFCKSIPGKDRLPSTLLCLVVTQTSANPYIEWFQHPPCENQGELSRLLGTQEPRGTMGSQRGGGLGLHHRARWTGRHSVSGVGLFGPDFLCYHDT